MPFVRNHVGKLDRWQIGLLVEPHQGVWGFVTQEAQERGVSRWFIDWCHRQVVGWLLWWEMSGVGGFAPPPWFGSREEAIVSLYLETEASLSGVGRSLETLFGQGCSRGQISGVLQEYGRALSLPEKAA